MAAKQTVVTTTTTEDIVPEKVFVRFTHDVDAEGKSFKAGETAEVSKGLAVALGLLPNSEMGDAAVKMAPETALLKDALQKQPETGGQPDPVLHALATATIEGSALPANSPQRLPQTDNPISGTPEAAPLQPQTETSGETPYETGGEASGETLP